MKNTIREHQELQSALFKCFHIKFQQHKEIVEGHNQSLESDSNSSMNSALGHIVYIWQGPGVSKRKICYSICKFFTVFSCFF